MPSYFSFSILFIPLILLSINFFFRALDGHHGSFLFSAIGFALSSVWLYAYGIPDAMIFTTSGSIVTTTFSSLTVSNNGIVLGSALMLAFFALLSGALGIGLIPSRILGATNE